MGRHAGRFNGKERQVLLAFERDFATLAELAQRAFPQEPKGCSWVRNSLRKPLAMGVVERVGGGLYRLKVPVFRVEIDALVREVTNRVCRRCGWPETFGLRRDFQQEGWVAALTALRSWMPSRGPFRPYAHRAVQLQIWRRLLEHSAPVSAPWSEVSKLAGLYRAPLEALDSR